MTDHRPAQLGEVDHGVPFAIRLLYLVFAEQAAARGVRHANALFIHGLAHGQQTPTGRIVPCSLACRCNARMDGREVATEVIYGFGLRAAAVLVVQGWREVGMICVHDRSHTTRKS